MRSRLVVHMPGADPPPDAPRRPRSLFRRVVLACVGLVLAVLVTEGLLQAACAVAPPVARLVGADPPAPPFLPDGHLGMRGNPAVEGFDARGFRNAAVPETADVVALGESRTWGAGVAIHETWPSRLDAALDGNVYSMAIPGWGPVERLLCLEEATALRPRLVLLCVFTGDDILGAHTSMTSRDPGETLLPWDPWTSADDAEATARFGDAGGTRPAGPTSVSGTSRPDRVRDVRGFLSRHSRLYGLARAAYRAAVGPPPRPGFEEASRRATGLDPLVALPVTNGITGTVLRVGIRFARLRGEDPRVARGERALRAVVGEMRRRCGEGTALAVVLLPTKETVWRGVPGVRPEGPPEWEALRRDEEALLQRLVSSLAAADIPVLDLLRPLRAAVARGAPVYFGDTDDHLAPSGHALVADLLSRWPPVTESLTAPAPTEGR